MNSMCVMCIIIIFVVVVVVFIFSYFFFLIIMIIRNIKKDIEDNMLYDIEVVYKFFLKFYFVNNVINFLIYSFFNRCF